MSELPLEERPEEEEYYCTSRQENIGKYPEKHEEEEHKDDNPFGYDCLWIQQKGDSFVAMIDGMGHVTPHVWSEEDGVPTCDRCGGKKVFELER